MKILVDSNIVIASLVEDGISREILFDENFKFLARNRPALAG